MSSLRFARALPYFFMGKTAANSRITEFRNSKHVLLSDSSASTETKSIWYSFTHIDDISKELTFLNADGLRIYIGQYEETHPDFPGQLCLVMVPTRLNQATMGHEDVIMEDDIDFSDRPGSAMFLGEEIPMAFNYGSPCPSICPAIEDSKYPFILDES